ncbi:reverse transcriptase domain-containing protein [Tanacetum coccineum]
MPVTRQGMTPDAIEELVTQRVADALATYEANWNTRSGNGSGNGNRSVSQSDGRSGSRRFVYTAQGYTYKELLNCLLLNFKGTEGAIGLAWWFEKIESVFNINNCAVECQVKYAAYTLLNSALTWWSAHVRTVRIDASNEMSWKEIMKLMTEAYCHKNEIQKLDGELWNLTVKGTDVVGYIQRFQELALLSPRMVPEEEDKVERYIWGLPDSIQGNVTFAGSVRLQDAVKLANNLMDQTQPPFKRHNVARANTARPSERNVYDGKLPLCNRCKLHLNGQCNVKCTNCKKVGHIARDCRSPTVAADQRAPVMNQRTMVTCFECGKQGHYKSDCPKLKNQSCGNTTRNTTGSSEARRRVYALGGGNADQDPNVVWVHFS